MGGKQRPVYGAGTLARAERSARCESTRSALLESQANQRDMELSGSSARLGRPGRPARLGWGFAVAARYDRDLVDRRIGRGGRWPDRHLI